MSPDHRKSAASAENAEVLLNAAVDRLISSRMADPKAERRKIERQASFMMAQAQVHATLAVLDKLDSMTDQPATERTPHVPERGEIPERGERSVCAMTRDDFIRFAEQFPTDTWFQGSSNGGIYAVDENGSPVKSRLWYPKDPEGVIMLGTRVRKFNYSDTGTVDRITKSENLGHVKWDHSGESWENLNELGVVTAGTDKI